MTKKLCLIVVSLICIACLVIPIAYAQGKETPTSTSPAVTPAPVEAASIAAAATTAPLNATPISSVDLFKWATSSPPDWSSGIILAVLGIFGALIADFGWIGGVVPGTAGKAEIDKDTERLEAMKDRLDTLIKSDKCEYECIKAVETAVNNFRDDIRVERHYQYAIGASVYLVLGGIFATMLAHDLLQAIVIGFGWTSVMGVLGLKQDYESRKSAKDDTLEQSYKYFKLYHDTIKDAASVKSEKDYLAWKTEWEKEKVSQEKIEALDLDYRIAKNL
jgi:hypothetical protein